LWQFVSRILSWFTIDFIVALGAAGIVGVIWRSFEVLRLGLGHAFMLALGGAVLFSLINTILGLDRVTWDKAPANQVFELIFSTGLTTGIMFVINSEIITFRPMPSGLVWLTGLVALVGFIIVRYRERLVTGMASRWLGARRKANTLGERVLIVGAGSMGELASWLLRRGEFSRGFSIVGMVDDNPHKVGLSVADCKVMGVTSDLPRLVTQYDVGVIIFAINEIEPARRDQILSTCFQTGARLALFPDMVEALKTSLSANERALCTLDRMKLSGASS
jgi:FlaA1/EpsC-like NDP-sugar epimerase